MRKWRVGMVVIMGLLLFFGCGGKQNVVSLFTVDPNGMDNEVDVVHEISMKEEVNPEKVLELYCREILTGYGGSQPIYLGSLVQDKVIMVNFSEEGVAFIGQGSFMEVTTLDGLAKSLLVNCVELEGVGYQLEGGGYSSGHFEFPEGYIYKERADFFTNT